MNRQVTCNNCGGSFSIEEPRCPYCSTLNPSGAESAYMRELEGLKDETDKLDDAVQQDLKVDFGRNAKRIVLIVAIVVALVIAGALATRAVTEGEQQQAIHEYQVREAFREQHFETFDDLYESGDDAALSEYVWSLSDDPGFEAVYYWNHIGYLEVYNDWEALRSFEDVMKVNHLGIDDYTWAASVAIRLGFQEAIPRYHPYSLSMEEETRAKPYREFAREFLRSMLQMNEEDTLSFITECADDADGLLKDKLERNLKARLSDLGTL